MNGPSEHKHTERATRFTYPILIISSYCPKPYTIIEDNYKMEVDAVLQNIAERQQKLSAIIDVDRNLVLDIGNLTAWDPESVVLPKAGPKREEYLKQMARDDAQVMINKLYAMNETEIVDGEKVLKLPEATTILPRGKPVPEPKQPTKWERFARDKGIKSKSNKTREKKVWDDTTQKWLPRYGYNKVRNDEQKDWLIEIPDQADPNVDYFAQKKEQKKEKIAKNKYQQLRNVAKARN